MADDLLVHVIDDDEAVRDSLAFLLASAGMKATTYDSASAFLENLPAEGGCVITDIRMPEVCGMALLRRLAGESPRFKVIVITAHGDVPRAVEAIRLGAIDFIEKPFDGEVLLAAVRVACTRHGDEARIEAERAETLAHLDSLSAREAQVMEGLVAGHPNKAIASQIGISPRTVEVYRANVMAKMRAGSLPHLVQMVLRTRDFR